MQDQPLRYGDDGHPRAMNFRKRKHHPVPENKDKAAPKPPRKTVDPWRSKKQQFRNVNIDDLDESLLEDES